MWRNDQSDDCACNPWMRSACFGEHYTDEAGKRFCLFHFPNKAKAVQFKEALDARLARGDAIDLSGVWFPELLSLRGHIFRYETNFRNATFAEGADFSGAVFKGPAHFSETTFIGRALFSARFLGISNFVHATFHAETSFCIAEFAEKGEFAQVTFQNLVDFGSAKFISEADFSHATFVSDVSFNNADFHAPLDFTGTEFGALANFDSSTFGSHVRFAGDGQREVFCAKSVLDLQHCRIARAEGISFHTVLLRPNWFVNVDSRKFVFAEITWGWKNTSIEREIERLNERQVASPYALLATACRQLAENAELNNRYEEASLLRYWAMDLARRTKWGVGGSGERIGCISYTGW